MLSIKTVQWKISRMDITASILAETTHLEQICICAVWLHSWHHFQIQSSCSGSSFHTCIAAKMLKGWRVMKDLHTHTSMGADTQLSPLIIPVMCSNFRYPWTECSHTKERRSNRKRKRGYKSSCLAGHMAFLEMERLSQHRGVAR